MGGLDNKCRVNFSQQPNESELTVSHPILHKLGEDVVLAPEPLGRHHNLVVVIARHLLLHEELVVSLLRQIVDQLKGLRHDFDQVVNSAGKEPKFGLGLIIDQKDVGGDLRVAL